VLYWAATSDLYRFVMTKLQKLLTVGSISAAFVFTLAVPSGALVARQVAPGHANVVTHAVKTKSTKIAFKGSYKGTITLLMVGPSGSTATSVTVTALKGTGTGTDLGASTVTATGSAPSSNQCDEISGSGSLAGAGSKLLLNVASSPSSTGCASGTSTPTSVTIKGVAKVTGGLGKFKGATGSLDFTAAFNVSSNAAGSTETDSFTATVSGTLTIKS